MDSCSVLLVPYRHRWEMRETPLSSPEAGSCSDMRLSMWGRRAGQDIVVAHFVRQNSNAGQAPSLSFYQNFKRLRPTIFIRMLYSVQISYYEFNLRVT